MEYMVTSDVTGKKYDVKQACRIINIKQQILYIKHGVPLLDMYIGKNYDNGRDLIVMVFDKKTSQPYYEKRCNHELD